MIETRERADDTESIAMGLGFQGRILQPTFER